MIAFIDDHSALCPLDHVNRQFHAPRPNARWVSDFTYVSTWTGFVYVAFVIDAYARRSVGWRVSGLISAQLLRPSHLPAVARLRSREAFSLATSEAFSNCAMAPSTWRTSTAVGVSSTRRCSICVPKKSTAEAGPRTSLSSRSTSMTLMIIHSAPIPSPAAIVLLLGSAPIAPN